MELCITDAIPNVTDCMIWHTLYDLARNGQFGTDVTFGTRKASKNGDVCLRKAVEFACDEPSEFAQTLTRRRSWGGLRTSRQASPPCDGAEPDRAKG